MQTIHKKNTSKKVLLTTLLVVAILLVLGTTYAYATKKWIFSTPESQSQEQNNVPKVDYAPPTDEQAKQGQEAKQKTIDEDQKNTSDPSVPGGLTVAITAASIEDGVLYIRTSINGVYGSGQCALTLKNGSRLVTKTAGIQALPQSSTCQGFNIPVSELASGTWTIELNTSIGEQSGTATSEVHI